MELRKLAPEDAAAFRDVRLQGLRECPTAFSSSYEEEAETSIQTVAGRLVHKVDGALFGCFANSRLSGVIGVQRETRVKLAHKAFIWGMYVLPDCRRHGIGRALVAKALDYATTEWGVLRVNLGVNARNAAAVALYESMGFRTYGTEIGFLRIDGRLHDEKLMAWTRASAA
jgi:ribosomal protein S18 acetylase RimI-like enzyme